MTPSRRELRTPLGEQDVRELAIGEAVVLTGTLFTARDAVHRFLFEGGELACDLRNAVVYHCGPVVVRDGERWDVTAAGPTTSAREEPYMPELIRRFGLRAVIGKGGMGEATLAAMAEVGCIYCHAVGGAAQVLAASIEEVETVHGYERFGAPEAVWQLRVRQFPAVVTMDTHRRSLHQQVRESSADALRTLL